MVETVFNVPGIGRLAYEGIHNADLPVIEGTVQAGAFFIVIANLVVDVGYAFLDPRVRDARRWACGRTVPCPRATGGAVTPR